MSSKILIAVLIGAMMFWETSASAQSAKLLDALQTAEEQQKQGQFVEAFKTLTAVKPTVSEASPISSLEKPYDENDAGIAANEFYLRDKALRELTFAFLENRESERAVITARHIANRELRNAVLLDILRRQCYAVTYKPQEFDLMIAKAEKTVLLLTGNFRDEGYAQIAERYCRADKYDEAVETWNTIEEAACRDDSLFSTMLLISNYSPRKEEKRLQDLTSLIQTPSIKAGALLRMAGFYSPRENDIDPTDFKRKRFEALQEAMDLLLPLPGDYRNAETMLGIYLYYCSDGHEAEAEIARNALYKLILSIEDEDELFQCYHSLLWYGSAIYPQLMAPELTEKVEILAEKTADPEVRLKRWIIICEVAQSWASSGISIHTEAFHKAWQTALEFDHPVQQMFSLLRLFDLADPTQIDPLLHDLTSILERALTPESSQDEKWYGHTLVWQVLSKCMQHGKVDRMLELVHLPQIPDDWSHGIYYMAAKLLLEDSKSPEFRADDFMTLFNLIDHPWMKLELPHLAEGIKEKFHWPQPIEGVLAISDPDIRYAMCRLLVMSNREQQTDTDVMPLLEAAFEVTLTENGNHNTKISRFDAMFNLSREYSLWDKEQIVDRLARYEASIARVPHAIGRFQCLHRMTWVVNQLSQDAAAKNAWIDRLLETVREDIPEIGYRLNAYLVTANQAESFHLPERAKTIVDEALAFAATIPKQRLPVAQIAVPLERLEALHDQL